MLDDQDLDRLLAHATAPKPAEGFETRMLARLAGGASHNVLTFPPRKTSLWFLGLPLAASLMFGMWLGASDRIDNLVPNNGAVFASSLDAGDLDSDDLEIVMEDQQS